MKPSCSGVKGSRISAMSVAKISPNAVEAPTACPNPTLRARTRPANGALTYNLEATWRKGPFWLAYEYIHSDVDSTDSGELSFDGQHFTASWALTGEMRPYRKRGGVLGPLPVAKSVRKGGWGAWEAALRYSTLDLTDGPIDGGQLGIYTLGLNWWLTSYSLLSLDYRHITLDRFGEEGTSNALTA